MEKLNYSEDPVIVKNLSKAYGKERKLAVSNVSFTVKKGELFGLIGPDGAGKTSILRMLATLLLPDQGSASVKGLDVVSDYKKIRGFLGYMPGKFSLYQDLSVEENLSFFATLFGTTVAENYDYIKDIYADIELFKERKAGKLSGGMKQKLALSCALIHKPGLLILDEPTTGVDPVSRKEFWEVLKKLRKHQITIIVSTPYMDEASICDRIALIQDGKILTIDSPQRIIDSYPADLYAVKANNRYHLLQQLAQYPHRMSSYAFGEYAHFSFREEPDVEALEQFLKEAGLSNIEIKKAEITIEDSFISLLSNG